MKYILCKNVRRIITGGVPVVGNIATGSFILLTKEGEQLFDEIQEGKEILENELNSNLKELLEVALEEEILATEEVEEGNIKIVSAYLHITNYCNLHCIGCYSNDSQRNRSEDLSLSQIKKILDVLHQQKLQTILISGGEPFLRDDIVEILKYARERIPQVIVGTNGTRITKQIAKKINGLVHNVSLSIDGFSVDKSDFIRDKGTFEKVLNAVKYLKEADVPFSLLPTIHRKNYKDVNSFLELAKEIDVPIAFSLLTCNTDERNLEDYVLTEQEFKDFIMQNSGNDDIHVSESSINIEDIVFKSTCGAGRNTVSIDARGFVYPCHMLHSTKYSMGNILVDSWDSILASKKIQDLVECDVDKVEGCSKCEYRYFCGGGCKARIIYAQNALYASDIYCEGLKDNYKRMADYFAKLAKNNN